MSVECTDFMDLFEQMNNLNMTLYLRESEIMKYEKMLAAFNDGSMIVQSNVRPNISEINRSLIILKKKQEKDIKIYSKIRKKFLDFIDKCDEATLRNYTQILTSKEHKFKEDIQRLEATCADEEELNKKRLLAKSYYNNIEDIYSIIDERITKEEPFRLTKVNKENLNS